MKENFTINYNEEWFDSNWFAIAKWGVANCERKFTLERTFVEFQSEADYIKFNKRFKPHYVVS